MNLSMRLQYVFIYLYIKLSLRTTFVSYFLSSAYMTEDRFGYIRRFGLRHLDRLNRWNQRIPFAIDGYGRGKLTNGLWWFMMVA